MCVHVYSHVCFECRNTNKFVISFVDTSVTQKASSRVCVCSQVGRPRSADIIKNDIAHRRPCARAPEVHSTRSLVYWGRISKTRNPNIGSATHNMRQVKRTTRSSEFELILSFKNILPLPQNSCQIASEFPNNKLIRLTCKATCHKSHDLVNITD